jgi:mannitol/fructose-specific phosphotransferase system IIA component (Ntr-type)
MYIVWLFDVNGFGVDYQFHTWHEAIEFMVETMHDTDALEQAEITEWELCRA